MRIGRMFHRNTQSRVLLWCGYSENACQIRWIFNCGSIRSVGEE